MTGQISRVYIGLCLAIFLHVLTPGQMLLKISLNTFCSLFPPPKRKNKANDAYDCVTSHLFARGSAVSDGTAFLERYVCASRLIQYHRANSEMHFSSINCVALKNGWECRVLHTVSKPPGLKEVPFVVFSEQYL